MGNIQGHPRGITGKNFGDRVAGRWLLRCLLKA